MSGVNHGFHTISRLNFEFAMGDVDILLRVHDSKTGRTSGRPTRELEVFKRAGVILAVTAWETFIEDTLRDRFSDRLRRAEHPRDVEKTFNIVAQAWLERTPKKPSNLVQWALDGWKALLQAKFDEDLSSFHTPTTEKIRKLFRRHLDVDIVESWRWPGVSSSSAARKLDAFVDLRGKLVHEARDIYVQSSVRRDDVVRGSKLLRRLAKQTEQRLRSPQHDRPPRGA